jgi:predicted dehydrogenase
MTPSSRPFRVGIIGAGGIAQAAHIPGWKKLPEVKIAAIADLNKSTAEAAASLAGDALVFTDYNELLQQDLDAVSVCTPNKFHTPVVLAALERGIHVLCEKPLAVTRTEIREMGELADKKKLILMTGQNHRYRAETKAIKKWVTAGNLGPVYHSRVRAMRRAWLPGRPGFIDSKLSGGGPCMDIGVHALDAALWAMDFPKAVRVSGSTRVNFAQGNAIPGKWGEWDRSQFDVEDFAVGLVHFDNGATLLLEAAWLGHQKEDEDFSFQLFGLKAGVHWPSCDFSSVQDHVFVDGKLSSPHRVENTHAAEIADFYQAVVGGGVTPVPWTETIEVIGILEAIYLSQKLGREVEVKL